MTWKTSAGRFIGFFSFLFLFFRAAEPSESTSFIQEHLKSTSGPTSPPVEHWGAEKVEKLCFLNSKYMIWGKILFSVSLNLHLTNICLLSHLHPFNFSLGNPLTVANHFILFIYLFIYLLFYFFLFIVCSQPDVSLQTVGSDMFWYLTSPNPSVLSNEVSKLRFSIHFSCLFPH